MNYKIKKIFRKVFCGKNHKPKDCKSEKGIEQYAQTKGSCKEESDELFLREIKKILDKTELY